VEIGSSLIHQGFEKLVHCDAHISSSPGLDGRNLEYSLAHHLFDGGDPFFDLMQP